LLVHKKYSEKGEKSVKIKNQFVRIAVLPATATAKAKSLGATVKKDVTEVPGMGWFSIIEDPTGAALGLWKAMPR
jgi:predicted enzyme related to lactoylglutathione lyase